MFARTTGFPSRSRNRSTIRSGRGDRFSTAPIPPAPRVRPGGTGRCHRRDQHRHAPGMASITNWPAVGQTRRRAARSPPAEHIGTHRSVPEAYSIWDHPPDLERPAPGARPRPSPLRRSSRRSPARSKSDSQTRRRPPAIGRKRNEPPFHPREHARQRRTHQLPPAGGSPPKPGCKPRSNRATRHRTPRMTRRSRSFETIRPGAD